MKYIRLACIVLVTFLASCNSDSGLVGKWQLFVKNDKGIDISQEVNNTLTLKSNQTFILSIRYNEGKIVKSGKYQLTENRSILTLQILKINDAKVVDGEKTPGVKLKIVSISKDSLIIKQLETGDQLVYIREK